MSELTGNQFLQGLYVAYWGRAADPSGFYYWNGQVGDLGFAGIAENFASSAEGMAAYAYFNAYYTLGPDAITDTMRYAFIDQIYANLFERAPDADGREYWFKQLKGGESSPGAFIANIMNAAYEGREGASADDWATMHMKMQAAEYFTDQLVENNVDWTQELSDEFEAVLAGVDKDSDLAAVKAQADAIVEGGEHPGQTFTLTTGADTIPGMNGSNGTTSTAGDDKINAVFDQSAASQTLTIIDNIDAGAGINSLDVRVMGTETAGTAFKAGNVPVLNNVQILNFTPLAAVASADLTGISPNLTTLNITNGLAAAEIAGIGANVTTFGIQNVTTDDADIGFVLAAGRTAADNAATLNVSGASAASTAAGSFADVKFTGAAGSDGIQVLNIMSTGSIANRLNLLEVEDNAASTLKTLNIEGSAAFRVNTALDSAALKTIDASKSSGGVNLAVTGGDIKFTGGSGNDRIDMGASLTEADTLNGSTGSNTLAIDQRVLTSTKSTAINKAIDAAQNFQTLEITTAAAGGTNGVVTLNADGVTTIKNFAFSGGGTATNAGAAGNPGLDAITVDKLASDNTNSIEISKAVNGGIGVTGGAGVGGGGAGGDALQLLPGTNGPTDETTVTLKGVVLTGGNGGAGNTDGDGGNGGYGINASAFETINLVSAGSTNAVNQLAGGTGGASSGTGTTAGDAGMGILVNTNAKINITGANNLTLTTASANEAAGGVQIDASTFTGKLNVAGTTNNDVIKAGMGNDTISGGQGRDTIDLTAGGVNRVDLTTALNVVATAASNRDTITAFSAGTGGDELDIVATGGAGLRAITGTSTAFTLNTTGAGPYDLVTVFNFAATNNSANLSAGTDGAELFKGIANQGSTINSLTVTADNDGYIAAYDGTHSYLYYFNSGGNTDLAANEIALVAVIQNVNAGDFTAANFV